MGAWTCTRDEEANCDGLYKVEMAALAEKLEANGFPHAVEYLRNN